MKFEYDAKTAVGQRVSGRLDASSRSDALRILRERGLTPLQVREASGQAVATKNRLPSVPLLFGLAVLSAVILFFVFRPNGAREDGKKKPARPPVSVPAAPVQTNEIPKVPQAVRVPSPKPQEATPVTTAPNPVVAPKPRHAVGVPPVETVQAKPPQPRRKPIFTNATEQVLSWIVSKRLGDMPPPIPRLPPDEKVLETLNSVIEIHEGDDEATSELKENVAYAKEEMRKFMEEGGTAQEFVRQYHQQLQKAHQEWLAEQREYLRLRKENPDEAIAYAEETNKRLAEKGIKPLIIPGRRP
ncbi:MAG: hypothetical protein IJR99_05360 [Kiritimatiellae bacterium]|nr:hypothetical protein [Kiritimatiellia bacterium]